MTVQSLNVGGVRRKHWAGLGGSLGTRACVCLENVDSPGLLQFPPSSMKNPAGRVFFDYGCRILVICGELRSHRLSLPICRVLTNRGWTRRYCCQTATGHGAPQIHAQLSGGGGSSNDYSRHQEVITDGATPSVLLQSPCREKCLTTVLLQVPWRELTSIRSLHLLDL